MTDRELMQQALEALQAYGAHMPNCDHLMLLLSLPPQRKPCSCGLVAAITALRERLAQHEALDKLVAIDQELGMFQQPEQEQKLSCGVDFADGLLTVCVGRSRADGIMEVIHLEQLEMPVQEPYGWKVYGVNSLFMGEFAEADAKAEAKRIGGTCIAFPLYTAPQPRQEWVGLTEDERGQVYASWRFKGSNSSNLELCRAIEAKLREKNT